MIPEEAVVHVVDEDDAVRESLSLLLKSAGFSCQLFVSAVDFLERYSGQGPGCLVLDLQMPGMDGLTLQRSLADRGIDLPIIFLTGHGDVPAAVSALRAGGVNFMEKPFDPEALIDSITLAIDDHRARIEKVKQKPLWDRTLARYNVRCIIQARGYLSLTGSISSTAAGILLR